MRNPIHLVRDFYHSTVTELKKCTWPTWSELQESTVVVTFAVALLSVFVFTTDYVIQLAIRAVTASF
ncbi:MAG: preprotein translocase subunit SecE [Lentisphaerae bacterium RIFOXYB12_FULL_65_16]|nr:MAG: preprotein translocase subunit SecE [Lentisphaerae bacterium RIFOXYA12_64_32]OGV93946.1 MAG: preprotein translocase subunit SecE [Lentisphaerae bacterium RIFOXYB12_FULL_65_16]